jgi:hypothetical protein
VGCVISARDIVIYGLFSYDCALQGGPFQRTWDLPYLPPVPAASAVVTPVPVVEACKECEGFERERESWEQDKRRLEGDVKRTERRFELEAR